MSRSKQRIWLVMWDGTRIPMDPEKLTRIEIELSHGQKLWIEPEGPVWYLEDEPGVNLLIIGGPQGLGVMHPQVGNHWIAVALKRRYKKKSTSENKRESTGGRKSSSESAA